jgi:hypothetical protein
MVRWGRQPAGLARCPFCNGNALRENSQGVPVCLQHKDSDLPDMKCSCGEWLDIRKGKYGVFFSCMSCGAKSLSKILSINKIADTRKPDAPKKSVIDTGDGKIAKPHSSVESKIARDLCIADDSPIIDRIKALEEQLAAKRRWS